MIADQLSLFGSRRLPQFGRSSRAKYASCVMLIGLGTYSGGVPCSAQPSCPLISPALPTPPNHRIHPQSKPRPPLPKLATPSAYAARPNSTIRPAAHLIGSDHLPRSSPSASPKLFRNHLCPLEIRTRWLPKGQRKSLPDHRPRHQIHAPAGSKIPGSRRCPQWVQHLPIYTIPGPA
jgi:hypothetical protein